MVIVVNDVDLLLCFKVWNDSKVDVYYVIILMLKKVLVNVLLGYEMKVY